MSRHPFEWITLASLKWAFLATLILTLVLTVTLNVLGGPLKTEASPQGIVSLELAGDLATAQAILASWGPEVKVHAGLNLGLDYLFLVSYPTAIGLGCILLAGAWPDRPRVLPLAGVILAWAQPAVGLLDALENYALIRVLLGSSAPYWPAIARLCAIPKFALVAGGLLCLILGALVWVGAKARGRF